MKKVILIEIILLLNLSLSIYQCILYIPWMFLYGDSYITYALLYLFSAIFLLVISVFVPQKKLNTIKFLTIEILLLFNFILSIYFDVQWFIGLHFSLLQESPSFPVSHYVMWSSIYLFAALSLLTVIILIAIKDFPVFKPLLEKLQARKSTRNALKAEKAEAAKQEKIKALESELEELKKD